MPGLRHDAALISDLPAELPEPAVVVTRGTDLRRAILTAWRDMAGPVHDHRQNAEQPFPRGVGGIPDNRAGAQIGGSVRAASQPIGNAL